MRRPLLFAAVFLVSCCLAGCSTIRVGERLPEADRQLTGPQPPLAEAWSFDAEAAFGPAPAVLRGDVLLYGTRQGELQALRVGEEVRSLGRAELGEAIEGRLAVAGTIAYVPVATGRKGVRAYDLKRGRTVWSKRYGPHLAGLVLDEEAGVLVAASHDGILRGLDPATGDERWRFDPDSTFGPSIGGRSYRSTPVLLPGGQVAAADDEGTLVVLDLATGRLDGSAELGAPVVADLAAEASGVVLASTTEGQLVAVKDGAVWWQYEAPPGVKLTTAVWGAGIVAVAGTDGVLRALRCSSSTPGYCEGERWTYATDGAFGAPPAIAQTASGALVFAGSMDKRVVALRAETGALVWDQEVDGRVKSAPVVTESGVLFFREPSEIMMFRASDILAQQTP